MNPRAFQEWIGRLALVALLLLVTVPTAGRLVHAAAAGTHAAHAVQQAAHEGHAAHANHMAQQAATPAGGRTAGTPRPAPGDADCDYCPLLASLLVAAQVSFTPADAPRTPATPTLPAAPRLAWLHPSGLGSRGPPHRG